MSNYDENRDLLSYVKRSIRSAIGRRGMSQRDSMILNNMPWVIKVAARYAKISKAPIDELVQEGTIGLIRAVDKYNPDMGKFTTYATYWIRMEMERFLNERLGDIQPPKHIGNIIRHVRRYYIEHGRYPSVEELMALAKCGKYVADGAIRHCSIKYEDVEDYDHGEEAEDMTQITCEDAMEFIASHLTHRQAEAVMLYSGIYEDDGEPLTMRQVASVMGVSAQRIGQILSMVATEEFRKELQEEMM